MTCSLILAFGLMVGATNVLHNEVVGELQIDQTGKTLTVIAVLEKRQLVKGLKQEVDCAPSEMMSLCAGQYFLQHLNLKADGKELKLAKVDQRLEQNSLVITYQISLEETIRNLDVMSTYMFHLNHHALLNLRLSIEGQTKNYQLNASKPSITANF